MNKDWQDRVLIEREELMEKYKALRHFMDTTKLHGLDMQLLHDQAYAMLEYIMVLDKRIKGFI